MGAEIDDLVALFADKLRLDGIRTGTPMQGSRRLVAEYHGQQVTLVLPESALRNLLDDGDQLAADLWGPSVSAQRRLRD